MSFYERLAGQKRIFFQNYNLESIASKLVIAFFVTDVILGTLIYYAGGLNINRRLLHIYYCYSLSGSVLTVVLAGAAMGLSAEGWFTFNTSVLNIAIGILTIMGCFVSLALQIYFVLLLRKVTVDKLRTKCKNEKSDTEYPIQIDEETVEKEKGITNLYGKRRKSVFINI